jgi:hypothetical protein
LFFKGYLFSEPFDYLLVAIIVIARQVAIKRKSIRASMVSRRWTAAARIRGGSNNAKNLKRTMTTAARTTVIGGELALAAGRVIAHFASGSNP